MTCFTEHILKGRGRKGVYIKMKRIVGGCACYKLLGYCGMQRKLRHKEVKIKVLERKP